MRAEDLFPYPPDPVFDMQDAGRAFEALRAQMEAATDEMTRLLEVVEPSWEGRAADAASVRMRAFRHCLDQAAVSLRVARQATDAYVHELTSARRRVDGLRQEFTRHWPNGLDEPCVNNDRCLDHGARAWGMRDTQRAVFADVQAAADTCSRVLRDNAPVRAGLFTPRPVLGPVPDDGGFLGLGIGPRAGDARRAYAERVMGLSRQDLSRWLSQVSEADLAALAGALTPEDRAALMTRLLTMCDPLLHAKICHAFPSALPGPGDGVGWNTPQASDGSPLPLYPSNSAGHDWASDINQGGYGDCWMLSTLAGVVAADPDWVAKHVHPNANGTVTVTLYGADGRPVPVTVTSELPTKDTFGAEGVWSGTHPASMSSGYTWAGYVEKAMASYYHSGNGPDGTYAGIEGDWAKNAGTYLTGATPTVTDDAGNLASALADGKSVVVSSRSEVNGGAVGYIAGNHAYTLTRAHDGLYYLRNPWGRNDPNPMTAEQLEKYFHNFTIIDPAP